LGKGTRKKIILLYFLLETIQNDSELQTPPWDPAAWPRYVLFSFSSSHSSGVALEEAFRDSSSFLLQVATHLSPLSLHALLLTGAST
jgi:hypothetical protein